MTARAMLPPPLRRKLDPRSRRRLARSELEGPLEVLVRTDAELTPGERDAIRRAGCEIADVVGNVLIASAPAGALEALAELSFVRRIELSRTLYPEGGGPP